MNVDLGRETAPLSASSQARGGAKTATMDRGSFESVIRAHQAELYRYARFLGADDGVSEDLVQDTFLTALRVGMPPETANVRVRAAWLRGVLRNLFLRYCRRRRAGPFAADADLLDRAETVWKSEFLRFGDGFDYLEALRKCVEELPERQRAALDMHYTQRKSRAEMAQSCAMTQDGIKSLMRRIRASLADCVRKRLAAEEA